jgi:hypothetical protein
MRRQSGAAEIEGKHYFVDEAGDPALFGARGKVLVGSEGCSRYFILGLADVDRRWITSSGRCSGPSRSTKIASSGCCGHSAAW